MSTPQARSRCRDRNDHEPLTYILDTSGTASSRLAAEVPMLSRDNLAARIRGEYREMPGLRLTLAQACRFWQVDVATCETLLSQLVQEDFLYKRDNGTYIAQSPTAGRRAKATLRQPVPLRRSA